MCFIPCQCQGTDPILPMEYLPLKWGWRNTESHPCPNFETRGGFEGPGGRRWLKTLFLSYRTAKLNCFTQSHSVGENKSLTKPPGPWCDLPRVYTVMLCNLITQSWSISSSCLTCYEKNLGWTQKVKLLENKECKGKRVVFNTA